MRTSTSLSDRDDEDEDDEDLPYSSQMSLLNSDTITDSTLPTAAPMRCIKI